MSVDPVPLVRAIAEGSGAAADLDRLVALGATALPAIVDGLAAGRNVPTLSTALAALTLPEAVGAFDALLSHRAPEVRYAAIAALGATRDAAALPRLLARLRVLPELVIDALADLGDPAACTALSTFVVEVMRPEALESSCTQERIAADVAAALGAIATLARLGDHAHAAQVYAALAVGDPSDPFIGAEVRAAAAHALWYVTAPGTAAALRRAARDPVREVAQAALQGMLLLGRAAEAEAWIAMIADGDPHAGLARWCLAAWAGPLLPDAQALVDADSAHAWWHQLQPFLVADRCYRRGQLADPGSLIDELAAPTSEFLRDELRARTGCPAVWERLVGDPASPGELATVRAWWAANAARFPAGQLHRWGRSVAPTAVD